MQSGDETTKDDGEIAAAVENHPVPLSDASLSKTVSLRPRSLVVLHWLTAVFLVVAVALTLTREGVDEKAVRQWLLEGHRHFGLFVFCLILVRVALRFWLGKLPSEVMPWHLRAAAAATHIAMYGLLLVQPLLGWALSNAQSKPVHLFGLTLPALVAPDEDLGDRLQAWHTDAAWLLLALVSLHVGAALWHHFVLRDGVLRAMSVRLRS